MAAFLYILQSKTSGKFYVGSTDDLERRLSEHERGHTPSTRGRGPWKLVRKEEFASLLEARRRELEIKRWKSSRLIRALIATPVGWSGPTGSARSGVRVPTDLPFPCCFLQLAPNLNLVLAIWIQVFRIRWDAPVGLAKIRDRLDNSHSRPWAHARRNSA
jgi:putative endonuclease